MPKKKPQSLALKYPKAHFYVLGTFTAIFAKPMNYRENNNFSNNPFFSIKAKMNNRLGQL